MKSAIVAGVVAAAFVAAPVWAASGKALLRGTAEGSPIAGEVTLKDSAEGLWIGAVVEGAEPGKHGFHVHEAGDCSDLGKAAGDHYNPAGAPHGDVLKVGPGSAHAGDLGNLVVGSDGRGTLEVMVPGICLIGCENAIAGRSFVFHEKQDDFGQPTGNAGGRAACGTIFLVRENG